MIGIGQGIGVSVTRSYLFGLVRLPVYSSSMGDISIFHDIFFYSIAILTGVFILMEIFRKKETIGYGQKFKYNIQKEEHEKMKIAGFQFNWKKFTRAIAFGLAFGFIAFILSADGGPSVALGLLVIYLEYKLK